MQMLVTHCAGLAHLKTATAFNPFDRRFLWHHSLGAGAPTPFRGADEFAAVLSGYAGQ